MERLFYKKKYAVLTIALTVVLVFLFCVLLGFLVQYATLKPKVEELHEMIKAAQNDDAKKQALLKYRETDEYVIEWAKSMGYLTEEETVWLESNR